MNDKKINHTQDERGLKVIIKLKCILDKRLMQA